MHLQENTLFDMDFEVKVTQNVAKYPLHYATYAPANLKLLVRSKVHLQENTFDL